MEGELEKATQLVNALTKLVEAIGPTIFIILIAAVFILLLFALVYFSAKAVMAFLNGREDRKLLSDNAKTMGKVENALNLFMVQGCAYKRNANE